MSTNSTTTPIPFNPYASIRPPRSVIIPPLEIVYPSCQNIENIPADVINVTDAGIGGISLAPIPHYDPFENDPLANATLNINVNTQSASSPSYVVNSSSCVDTVDTVDTAVDDTSNVPLATLETIANAEQTYLKQKTLYQKMSVEYNAAIKVSKTANKLYKETRVSYTTTSTIEKMKQTRAAYIDACLADADAEEALNFALLNFKNATNRYWVAKGIFTSHQTALSEASKM